ncbi:MAG: ABC transporter ATP-binding protein [Propionibacteriaceae bacterium]|jgi:ABC-type lipoprotein export system ATPase subunit|nr:ABC transporter ATP-binding protein [Propionibacteriaceae bacterium]
MSVKVCDVSHRYGSDPWVLRSVSMTLQAGLVAAVVGPSGSGKSTLLAIIGGLLKPTTGSVSYDISAASSCRGAAKRASAQDGGGPLASRRQEHNRTPGDDIAWVFQTSNLLPRRSVLDNAMMGPLSRGYSVSRARQLAVSALADVGVDHLARSDIRHISGGEAQRVGIARALATQPCHLLADEPTGHLDQAATTMIIQAFLRRRNTSSVTLIATHDMAVAGSCDLVYTLRDGRISQEVGR